MRRRLFLILIGVVVLSLASGFGLRFVSAAWQEPTAAPPGDNVPGPINVGSGAQTKAGSLTIGGVFTVVGAGSGAVIGAPTGGNQGEGSLNAVKLCINGVCYTSWPTATDVFVQNGNSFGALATLGTNDAYGLAFETNNVQRMLIDASGLGTFYGNFTLQSPTAGIGKTLTVSDNVAGSGHVGRIEVGAGLYGGMQIRTLSNGDLGLRTDGTGANGNISFFTSGANERMRITSAGNVGIGTVGPSEKLEVIGNQRFTTAGSVIYALPSSGYVTNLDLVAGGTSYLGNGAALRVQSSGAGADGTILFSTNQGGVGAAERMRITNVGNVGIGTNNPSYKLVVAGVSSREYIWATSGNPELDFGDGTTHWAVYRDAASNELRFWQTNNNVTMTAAGDINSRRCFGPVYVGQTAATYDGARGGYDDANALCAAAVAGSHVCTTSEILETIKCNQASLPTTDQAWISNGPPGYTARANDCTGWTSTSPSGSTTVYGAIWAFDANGGVGWVTTCNQTLKFACCK